MTSLPLPPPFVFPEPRVIAKKAEYEENPPYAKLALHSKSILGVVSGLTMRGIDVMRGWLERTSDLKVALIVVVYPTCRTKQADLTGLLDLVEQNIDRLSVYVLALEKLSDRAANVLCFKSTDEATDYMLVGPSEDLGCVPDPTDNSRVVLGQANLGFRADAALMEVFRRYFDYLWGRSRGIDESGVAQIPALMLPPGSYEGARLWQDYLSAFSDAAAATEKIVQVDDETGEVTVKDSAGVELPSPTKDLGLEPLDPPADRIARIYEKGVLVSIDKLSRVPPLDAPLDPATLGDRAETHRGNIVRKVSMRVSIVDERDRKEIDKRRRGIRALLTKFTFGLADGLRWMPNAARELFDSELDSLCKEGDKLIADVVSDDIDAFVGGKRESLTKDMNAMYKDLGRAGEVTEKEVDRVLESLKARLKKAREGKFMPALSYSRVSFLPIKTETGSPWGQAHSLLADVAAFPRQALSDPFFLRGLKTDPDLLIKHMNVADDALLRDMQIPGMTRRCKDELALLSEIEEAQIDSRRRCELILDLLDGKADKVHHELTEAEAL